MALSDKFVKFVKISLVRRLGWGAACCTEKEEAKEPPFPAVDHATRTEFGPPRSSIRLRAAAAMATSVARASSLWQRSPSPMTLYVGSSSAGDHIPWAARRAVSLRICLQTDRARRCRPG